MKKLSLMVAMLAVLLLINGCGDQKAQAAEQSQPDAAKESKAVDTPAKDAVAVTVNGQPITEKEISLEVEKGVAVQKKQLPAGMDMPETITLQLHERVVDMKIEQILLNQEMKNKGLSVSDEQVLNEIKSIAAQNKQSLEDVEKEVTEAGMTMEDVKQQIRMQMQIKALMASQDPNAVVTDAEAKKFYDDNPEYFNQPEEIRASHILLGRRGITEEEYPAELEKIKAAQARLKAGEAFEDVAKDVSTCPSAPDGGDLDFFPKGQMDPAFEEAAFALKVGQTSDIVKTSFGYHIIKVTDKKEASVTSFEESKAKITQFLTQQKLRQFWPQYDETMRAKATIVYSEKEKALMEQAKKLQEAQQAMQQQMMMQQMQQATQPQDTDE